MDPTVRPTITAYFAQLLIERAVSQGMEKQELLQAVRLDADLLAHPDTRISPGQLGALMRRIWHKLDDELFGFGAAPHRFGTFALMARHTTACQDLREALGYSVQFYRLTSPAFSLSLQEDGEEVCLAIETVEEHPSHFVEEFMLLVWHRYFNWLIGQRMPLRRTEFRFARPAHTREHRLMFPGPIRYEAARNAIHFPSQYLSQPVVRKRADLRRYLQHLPDEWFIKQEFEFSLADRVYHALMEAAPGELPEMAQLADHWRTTTRTLHRHLGQEQTSFRELRDQVRRDKAIYYLQEDPCSVGEIAARLAMTEPAFSRAFKKWTGLTPLAYRRSRALSRD